MDSYRTYKRVVVGFLVVFAVFLGAVTFWPEPASVAAEVTPSAVQAVKPSGAAAPAAVMPAGGGKVDSKPLLSSENQLFLEGMIEQFSMGSQAVSGYAAAVVPIASASAEPIVVVMSSGSSADTSSASSGSPSGGASSTSADSTAPRRPSGGSGGGAASQQPKKLFMFAGIRNQSHFRVLEYPLLRPLFAPDFVWHVTGFRNDEERLRMVRLLREHNPKVIIGYYHSACTTLPPEKDYDQPSKMPNEHVPNNWILRHANGTPVTWPDTDDRFVLDLRKEEVRQSMISLAIARAKQYGYDALSFDNCYWGYGVPASTGAVVSAKDWTDAFMKFYEEAGKAARENDLKCVVNVAAKAGDIPRAFEAIAPFVDGIMTEMPFHENIVKAGRVHRELEAYEKAAKEGTMVLLMQTYEGSGLETLRLARPLVNKYDNIYLSIVDFGRHYFYHGRENWHMSKAPPISAWYRNP